MSQAEYDRKAKARQAARRLQMTDVDNDGEYVDDYGERLNDGHKLLEDAYLVATEYLNANPEEAEPGLPISETNIAPREEPWITIPEGWEEVPTGKRIKKSYKCRPRENRNLSWDWSALSTWDNKIPSHWIYIRKVKHTYRPFQSLEEYLPYSGLWVRHRDWPEDTAAPVKLVWSGRVYVNEASHTFEEFCERFVFAKNNKPCGMKVKIKEEKAQ